MTKRVEGDVYRSRGQARDAARSALLARSARGGGARGGVRRAGAASAAASKVSKASAGVRGGGRPRKDSGSRGGVWGRLRRSMLAVVAVPSAVASALAALARMLPSDLQSLPYVPVLVAAMPWFVIVAALSFVCALASRRFVAAVVALAALAVNAWWQYPFLRSDGSLPKEATAAVALPHADTSDAYARVMTFNVYKGRADAERIVQTVRDQRVEVLALQETTDDFVEALRQAGIEDYLPYSQVSSSDGVYGNGLWSATPLGDPVDDEVHSSASFMPGGTVGLGGKDVRFVSVHTTAPVPGYWRQWRRSLDELGRMRAKDDATYVFMGDFNATYDHTPFRNFLGTRFRDAARASGHGFTFTWPADRVIPPRFAGIDHVVVDRGVSAGQMQVVRIAGSDHAALLATLAVG